MTDLQAALDELRDDVMLEAEAGGIFQQEAFFQLYAEVASDSGDAIDLEHAHAHRDGGSRPYRVDGHAFDHDRGTLYMAVCDFRDGAELETLNAAQIDSFLRRVANFFENSLRPDFVNALEDSSAAFSVAYPIFTNRASIKRLRIVLFSNARLVARRAPQLADEIAGVPVVFSVLDLARYTEIQRASSTGAAIEIDIAAIAGAPLPCLRASSSSEEHESYLLAIPGDVLADVYGLHGARLLEQNVRTYLQAKTKVNRGILTTIKDAPQMFFAFNNGLTATASAVRLEKLGDGQPAISSISNLQIVNGGQTTASILYAKDFSGSSLERVHVPVKLSVVPESAIEQIVPKISRFANTQNRISEADFFSSHPFHLQMERFSRRLAAPPQAGALSGSKWFYERARGQYRDGMAYATEAEKRKYQLEFPKDKVIEKTDLAKYVITFDCRPDIVSRHAQKCFMYFAEQIAKQWKTSQSSLNENWYRSACAMALLFNWTDRMVARSEWYATDRAYKSQTVTYTLAWLTNRIISNGKAGLDFLHIWKTQDVPSELQNLIEILAPLVARAIRETPENLMNVGEYCKTQGCWEQISKRDFEIPDIPDHLTADQEDTKSEERSARSAARLDSEIELDVFLLSLVSKADLVRRIADRRGLLSPKSSGALEKLHRGVTSLSRPERNAIRLLVKRLAEEGAPVETIG
ncbi:AIPR family protein [Ensifer sp. ENS12]|uniref:AIPR family protein n=1 Tax=Ensifer sp. ENS12 TaxID=2854774 RepID=UPI001C45556E|nr:AIPR family protein [Ensifer sp. ENS12]MBV7522581.1 AIPR family protein [Ensifer sp. ENS12]